jgi:hypothetical protein
VGRDVDELTRPVARHGNDVALAYDNRADRNLAAPAGRLGFAQRQLHEMRAGRAHLASPRDLC